MTDYKTMYTLLCKAIDDALEALSVSPIQTEQTTFVRGRLTDALEEAENIYIETCSNREDSTFV